MSEPIVSLDVRHDNAMRFIVQFPNGKQRGVIVPIELEANYFAAEKAVEEWAAAAWVNLLEADAAQARYAARQYQEAERRAAQMAEQERAAAERARQTERQRAIIAYRSTWVRSSPERDAEIVAMRESGASLRKVGVHFGLSPERVSQIERKAERVRLRAKHAAVKQWHADRANLGRPIDMGGTRDVWQEFTPETAFA